MKTFLEQAFGKTDVTTPKMRAAIREWNELYYGLPRRGEAADERLPVLIVGKLCRTVFAEYESRIADTASAAHAAWLRHCLAALDAVKRTAMQYALLGGECLLKPVLCGKNSDKTFEFVPIRRDCYAPLGRDAQGRLLAVGTMELIRRGSTAYALLERRTAGADGLRIETRLFELAGEALGREVPLETLPQTARLRPTLLLPGVQGVGLAVLRTPLLNCVDGSSDAVAVFAPAVGLIHTLARTEKLLQQEFENGAARVFASEDLLRSDGMGGRSLQDDLFVGLPDDPANLGVTVYAPPLREQSYLARRQDLLRSCESLIGLKRGILSEVEAAERTATEITSSEGDYALTIADFQQMWQAAAQQAIALCSELGGVYGCCAAGETAALGIDWGDGVLYDRRTVWAEYRQLVADGLLKPELALAWYFDLPHASAADLAAIREKYMPNGGDEDSGAATAE